MPPAKPGTTGRAPDLPSAKSRYIFIMLARGERQPEDHMATGPDLRIGDSDREAAAARLREHYAAGRLTMEEFNQRLDATFAATTQRQLTQISRDLPHVGITPGVALLSGQAGPGGRERSRRHYRTAPRFLRLLPVIVAVLTVWLLAFDLRFFPWPGRLAIFLAVLAFARGLMRWIWRQAGPRRGRR
jgi:hypothetical protein